MDITRHWRLKTARGQLMATRCHHSGRIVLAQQSSVTPPEIALYRFETTIPARYVPDLDADELKAAK